MNAETYQRKLMNKSCGYYRCNRSSLLLIEFSVVLASREPTKYDEEKMKFLVTK